MPHKFNADPSPQIPEAKRRVTNWAEYNEGLRQRGDLTGWVSDGALALWAAAPRTMPGGQAMYSDLAIETCLAVGLAFKQPLRQRKAWRAPSLGY